MNIQEHSYKDSHQQHSVTQLWRHTATNGILHKNLKYRDFTYTAALFTATVLLLLMELTEQKNCTVQQPFAVPTDSVQWTLCAVGATDWMVAVHNAVIQLVVCVDKLLVAAAINSLTAWNRSWCFFNSSRNSPLFCKPKCSLPHISQHPIQSPSKIQSAALTMQLPTMHSPAVNCFPIPLTHQYLLSHSIPR